MARIGGMVLAAILATGLGGCAPAVGACAPAAPEPARPDPSHKEADARHLIELTDGADLANKSVDQIIANFQKNIPIADGDFWRSFREEIDTRQFVDMAVPLYVEKMSHESILAAIAFMESPSGRQYIKESGDLTLELQALGMKWGTILAAQVIEKLKAAGYSTEPQAAQ